MSKKGKVLVAMSGGIDSSVTAMMLHEQGYEVIGITMKTWDYDSSGAGKRETGCCSLDSINDARSMAVNFGFPHYILDIRGEFGEFIINNFVEEYLAGRTPNPCVLCNTHIKWNSLLRRADMLDCEFIATGHYGIINELDGRKYVTRARDQPLGLLDARPGRRRKVHADAPRVDHREEGDDRHAQRHALLCGAQQVVQALARHAGHGGHGLEAVVAFVDEDGVDQVRGLQRMLAHQRAGEGIAAQAAGAGGRKGGGGQGAGHVEVLGQAGEASAARRVMDNTSRRHLFVTPPLKRAKLVRE